MSTPSTKRIFLRLQPWASDAQRLAVYSLGFAALGARLLILRSTVRDCIATQLELERDLSRVKNALIHVGGKPAVFHHRFAAADRGILQRTLEAHYGRNATTSLPLVGVATPPMIRDLDLDADHLVTDVAPMEELIRRMSTLVVHHDRPRPPSYEVGTLVVLTPATRTFGTALDESGAALGPHGWGTIHRDLLSLEMTVRVLEERREIRLPEMEPEFRTRSTDRTTRTALVRSLGTSWQRHDELVSQAEAADMQANEVLHVPLDNPVRTMLGHTIESIGVPRALLRDTHSNEPAQVIAADGESFRFVTGGRTFSYDRLGLRPDDERPEDDRADA